MKALIVFDTLKGTDNLFVSTLCEAIRRQGVDVHCSLQDFWEDNCNQYEVIHFQWPEEVVGWTCSDRAIVQQLKSRLEYFKMQGCRFVYTRHNERPHYHNLIIEEAYYLIESFSDIVVHMGTYSINTFSKEYPDKKNVLIPHHIYEQTYDETINQQEARIRLGIPQNALVVTAFGKFRNNGEIFMTLNGFCSFKNGNKILLAPRMLPFSKHPKHSNPIKKLLSLAGYWLTPNFLRIKHIYAGMSEELVDDSMLPYYLTASDILLIQRKHILNSGNVPLAFLFRKVVVGPATGNIKEWLNLTGNPTFDPNNTGSISNALKEACQLVKAGKGEENHQYATLNMSLEKVASMYAKTYKLFL